MRKTTRTLITALALFLPLLLTSAPFARAASGGMSDHAASGEMKGHGPP